MPVLLYTGQHPNGTPRESAKSHEQGPMLDLVQQIYAKLHDSEHVMAIIANVSVPPADLVIVTQFGIGVLELKHCAGHITLQSSGAWGCKNRNGKPKLVYSGNGGNKNPHQQVRSYAKGVRTKLLKSELMAAKLKHLPQLKALKLQNAVLFTNPDANVTRIKGAYNPTLQPWEDFSIRTLADIDRWFLSLRFGFESQIGGNDYDLFRFSGSEVRLIAEQVLHAVPWKDAARIMPAAAYGQLTRVANGVDITTRQLVLPQLSIGRDAGNSIVVPQAFGRASREHVVLKRTAEGIYVRDVSSNGVYINNVRMQRTLKHIAEGDALSLGGQQDMPGVASYRFGKRSYTPEVTMCAPEVPFKTRPKDSDATEPGEKAGRTLVQRWEAVVERVADWIVG